MNHPSTAGEMQYAQRLGLYLRKSRLALNIPRGRAAREVGVHRNTLLRWEQGESMPNVYQLMLLQRLLRGTEAVPVVQEQAQ